MIREKKTTTKNGKTGMNTKREYQTYEDSGYVFFKCGQEYVSLDDVLRTLSFNEKINLIGHLVASLKGGK